MPSTSAPRSSSRRAMTSTSPMRGTFSSTHCSSVIRQAATSGSAEFLLPSTSMRPLRRWPPSISRVDTLASGLGFESSEAHDFVRQLDVKLPADFRAASLDQRSDVGGAGAAGVDDEVAVARRDQGTALAGPFQPRPIDQ